MLQQQMHEEAVAELTKVARNQLIRAYERYKASGRLPAGVEAVKRPPPLKEDATLGERMAFTTHECEVLRALAFRCLGAPGAVWEYEIIIRDLVYVDVKMKYVGKASPNVIDIQSRRMWTGVPHVE